MWEYCLIHTVSPWQVKRLTLPMYLFLLCIINYTLSAGLFPWTLKLEFPIFHMHTHTWSFLDSTCPAGNPFSPPHYSLFCYKHFSLFISLPRNHSSLVHLWSSLPYQNSFPKFKWTSVVNPVVLFLENFLIAFKKFVLFLHNNSSWLLEYFRASIFLHISGNTFSTFSAMNQLLNMVSSQSLFCFTPSCVTYTSSLTSNSSIIY